jgi:C-terminal processing protease CtpA/Prc
VASRSGLRTNDKIISVDGRRIRNARQLMAYLCGQDGRRVPLVVQRDGKQLTLQLPTTQASGDGAWLGIFLEQGEENAKGATITHVYPAGPAARAGLRSGDVILAVNGEECLECSGLIESLEKQKAGEKIQLTVQRGEQQLKVDAKLANRNQFVFSGPRGEFEEGEAEQWSDDHEHDSFFDIPEHAMELEAHRRLAEQHERIENLIQQLRGEVQALREELKTKR